MVAAGFTNDIKLCAICAGKPNDAEGGKIDLDLQKIGEKVLTICNACKSFGEKTLVGRYIHNGKAIQQRFDQNLLSMAGEAARH